MHYVHWRWKMPGLTLSSEDYETVLTSIRQIADAVDLLRATLDRTRVAVIPAAQAKADPARHELTKALESSALRGKFNAVDRYLHVLGAAAAQNSREFEKVLALRGRGRVYFAKSKEEIEASGTSTQPRQIPSTRYWAM